MPSWTGTGSSTGVTPDAPLDVLGHERGVRQDGVCRRICLVSPRWLPLIRVWCW